MSESMRDDVAREAERLVHLLSHPEPGIASWHEACERAYQRLIAVASPYAVAMREALEAVCRLVPSLATLSNAQNIARAALSTNPAAECLEDRLATDAAHDSALTERGQ